MKRPQTLGWLGGVAAGALALACCAVGPAVVAGTVVGGIAAVTILGWTAGIAMALVGVAAIALTTRKRTACRVNAARFRARGSKHATDLSGCDRSGSEGPGAPSRH